MKKRADSFFGLHLDLHPKFNDSNLGADLSRQQIEKLLIEVKPDYVTYDCKGHEGYAGYETEIGYTAPSIVSDSIKMWREETLKRDISMGIHYSGLQDMVYVQNHSDIAVQDKNGRTDGRTASVFSDYVDRLIIPQLSEVVSKYGLNGVWLDAECWGAQIDYSPSAKMAWQEFSGTTEIPDSPDSPLYKKWQEFHREAFHSYMLKWTDEMNSRFPKLDCCSNWAYTTMMPVKKRANIAMISGDFDPFLSLDRARTECRYLENNNFPWELQTWGFDLVDGQGPCQKAEAQIMQEAATVLMHGGAYMNYFLPTRGGYISDRIIKTLKAVSEFCFARKDVSYKSVQNADIAIIYTTKSQLDRSDKVYAWWGNRLDELEGILHLCCENNFTSTVLGECQIDDLSGYRAVLVPECDSLEENTRLKIIEYVSRGGKAFFFGGKISALFQKEMNTKISALSEEVTTLAEGEDKIQFNGKWANAEKYGTAELHRYCGKDVVTHGEYIDARECVSSQTARLIDKKVAAVSAKLNGGEMIAFLGDLGLQYFKTHHHYIRNIFKNMILKRVKLSLKINAPSVVDVSKRITKDGKLSLHLLNTSNMPVGSTRKFSDFIPQLKNIEVAMECSPITKATQFPENRELKVSYKDGVASFTVEELHIHSCIVLE